MTSRQGCAEKVEIDEYGRISHVPITSCGLNGGPLKGKGIYPAYIACHLEDKKGMLPILFGQDVRAQVPHILEQGQEHFITNIFNQVKWGYKMFELEADTLLRMTVRGNAQGKISIYVDVSEKELVVQVAVRLEGDHWTEVKVSMKNRSGILPLYFVFEGVGRMEFLAFQLGDEV